VRRGLPQVVNLQCNIVGGHTILRFSSVICEIENEKFIGLGKEV
jgi:hypothetical protein